MVDGGGGKILMNLKCDILVSKYNLKCNLYRYSKAPAAAKKKTPAKKAKATPAAKPPPGRSRAARVIEIDDDSGDEDNMAATAPSRGGRRTTRGR